jgi:hypothetical protein
MQTYSLREEERVTNRNTERLKLMMPAFERVGFPESGINVLGRNDYVHFPWKNIVVAIKFAHQDFVTAGELWLCRRPESREGLERLQALVKRRIELRAGEHTGATAEIDVELAATFSFVRCNFIVSLIDTPWEDKVAARVHDLVKLYMANLA